MFGWLVRKRQGMRYATLPWPLAVVTMLLLWAGSLWTIANRLQVNNAPEAYYTPDAPAVLLRNALRKDFPNDEALTVVFQGKDLYSQDFLSRLGRLTDKLQRHPLVDRVISVTTVEHISGSADGFAVEPLVDVTRLSKSTPEAIRQRVMQDRFAPGTLASKDGKVLAIAVRPKPLSESSERLSLSIAVALAVNDAGLRPYYAGEAGPITVDVAQLEAVIADTKRFVPLTVAIGLGLLAWVVGRWRPVAIGGAALATVVLPMIAAIALSGRPYTMATAILPSLLSAYTIATLLHLYAAMQRAQSAAGSRADCVDRALDDTFKPSLFNVLTTGAGLLSMVLVPIPPIQVFGVAGALGTALVFFAVFVLVPSLMVRWGGQAWPVHRSGMSRLGRAATRIALVSMRHPKKTLAAATVLTVITVPLAMRVDVESDVLAFFAADHPISRHTRLIESKLSGVTTLEISLRGAGRDSLQSVASLTAVRELQRRIEALPEVDRTLSMVDLVEEMHWAMNDEQSTFRVLPTNDRLLRQYLLVYDGRDLFELVNRDYQHARILLNLRVHGAREIGAVVDRIRAIAAQHPIPGVQVDVGGYGRLFADQVDLLVTGQVNSFAGAFVQIALFIALLFRSIGAAILCLIPNLAPLYIIFVLMGACGIHLDLATVMIAGVVLGITVDDTIHLYHGYRHRRREQQLSPMLAIARSFESSGRAVLAITLILVSQFALMLTSSFQPTANFGLLTAAGLLAGQFAELALLPALLVVRETWRQGWRSTAAQRRSKPRVADDDTWMPTQLLDRETSLVAAGLALAPMQVQVCTGDHCAARGAESLWQQLVDLRVAGTTPIHRLRPALVRTSCTGTCGAMPAVQVVPPGVMCGGHDAASLLVEVQCQLIGKPHARP